MVDNGTYSAAEAITLLGEVGISQSTFYRWVQEGRISKETPAGRVRGAIYPRQQVDNIINQERNKLRILNPEKYSRLEKDEDRAAIDWAKASDLPYMLAYDYEMYGPEGTVDISITRRWWEKNPYMALLMFDRNDRRDIWGGITILAMKEETIFRVLKDELVERDLTADDIESYESGKTYFGYIASATVKPEKRHHFKLLLESLLDFWCEQYPDIQLSKLYAYAFSKEGLGVIKHLFFSPRYDLGPNTFELDPYTYNPSPLIQGFQACIEAKKKALVR